MSSVVLRRLSQTCRLTSSLHLKRTFATSLPVFTETNDTNDINSNDSSDSIRTITLIPGNTNKLFLVLDSFVLFMLGDGIGPEISHSVQKIFEAADVPVKWEAVDVTPVKSVGHRIFV
jgi:hypothetical protein